MKVTLVLATLNEIDGMRAIMPRIKKEWYDQIVIIDGGSTDGTQEYAKENGYFLKVQEGKGIRTALDQAFSLVEGDILITFTPDGNSIPELIPSLIQKMKEGYDMVMVSRYLGDAKSYDDSFLSGKGNRAFTFLINKIYNVNYTDSLIGFRAYKKETIKKIGLVSGPACWFEKMFYGHTSWDFLSSVRCAKRKLKVAEIPGDEPARIGGVEKVQKFKVGFVLFIQMIAEIFLNPKES